jgi:hypothetical protein
MLSDLHVEYGKLFNEGDLTVPDAISDYILSVAKKVHPEYDWENHPMVFRLSDEKGLEGGIYKHFTPALVVISKGLMDFIKDEDELAFVLAHEDLHYRFWQKFGDVKITKTEEAAADIVPLTKLIDAGYNPYAGISFFTRISAREERLYGKKNALEDIYTNLVDPHPEDGNRIFAIQTWLGKQTLMVRGAVDTETRTPLAPIARQSLGTAKHRSFLDDWLDPDYDTWSPAQKLEELSGAAEFAFLREDLLRCRMEQVLQEVSKLKSDGSNEYRAAANRLIDLAAQTDPYNKENLFDPIYKAVARTFSDDTDKKLEVLGPFVKLKDACEALLNVSPDDLGGIQEKGDNLARTFDELSPWFFPTPQNGDQLKTTIPLKTELNEFFRNPTREKLYPLAQTDSLKTIIWQFGGAEDENVLEMLGAKKVAEFIDDGLYYVTSSDREYGWHGVSQRAKVWASKKRYEASDDKKPATILAFRDKFEYVLFPTKEDKLDEVLRGNHPIAEEFAALTLDQFQKNAGELADPRGYSTRYLQSERNYLTSQLEAFYRKVSYWIDGLGRDNADHKMFLPESHPYVQLLASDDLKLGAGTKHPMVSGITDPRTISPKTARKILEYEPEPSVEGCLKQFQNLRSELAAYDTFFLTVTMSREINGLMDAKEVIPLNDKDLNSLVRVTPDNPVYQFGASADSCAGLLISPELKETLFKKLWVQPDKDIRKTLSGNSLDQVASLYRFLEVNRLFPSANERAAVGSVLLEKIKDLDSVSNDVESRKQKSRYLDASGKLSPRLRESTEADEASVSTRLSLRKISACERVLLASPFDFHAPEQNRPAYVTANLSLRNDLIRIWSAELLKVFGADSGDEAYQKRIEGKIDFIATHASLRDKKLILEALADTLLVQDGVSQKIKDTFDPTAEDVVAVDVPIRGAEALMSGLKHDGDFRRNFIDFISAPNTPEALDHMYAEVKTREGVLRDLMEVYDDKPFLFSEPSAKNVLADVHSHIASLSSEGRSAILSALLIPPRDRTNPSLSKERYEEAFDVVVNKVFPPWAENAAEARSFLRAYLDSAKEHEQGLLLGGLLSTAIDEDPSHPMSTPQKAAHVLSSMGPAYVKLGQVINSNPTTPEDWRQAMSHLKSAADREPRWDLILDVKEKLNGAGINVVRWGEILGSASFNIAMQTTVEHDGKTVETVALKQRPYASNRASSGFEHLENAVRAWDSPLAKKHGKTFIELFHEAKEISLEETSKETGDRQFEIAQQVYAGQRIVVEENGAKTIVNINPVHSLYSGDEIRLLSLAEGTLFANLPEKTDAEKQVKKTLAKAYLAFEASTVLSSDYADCDRHGQQLKVKRNADGSYDLNIYDFGCMDTVPASMNEKTAVGRAVRNIVLDQLLGLPVEKSLNRTIKRASVPEERSHLARLRKGALAWMDFAKYLDSKQDVIDVVRAVVQKGIDPVIEKKAHVHSLMKLSSVLGMSEAKARISIETRPQAEPENAISFAPSPGQKATPRVPRLPKPDTPPDRCDLSLRRARTHLIKPKAT